MSSVGSAGSASRNKSKRNRWAPGGKQVSAEALKRYMPTTPVLAPDERDLEGRRVHRVREYWLEYEAMRNLQVLQNFKIPAALFEARMCEVNRHNSRFVPSSIGESAQNFFREFDDGEVLCLVIKLSEKALFRKPSRNILKRWNLSNGMLYLFYSVIGRSHPPTAKEVLEPFYYQKRIDFVRVVCLLPANTIKAGGTRKRQREAQKVLSSADLEIKAGAEVSDLYGSLEKELGPEVSEVAVAEAVEKGVWVCQGGAMGDEEDDGPMGVWRLNVDKVQDWGFDNGALQVFVQACSRKWGVVKPAWDQWNTELGNNAVAWEELWKNPENDADEMEEGQNSLGSPPGSQMDDDDSRLDLPSPQRSRLDGSVFGRDVYTPRIDSDDSDDDDDSVDDEPAHDQETGEPITEAALNLLRLAGGSHSMDTMEPN